MPIKVNSNFCSLLLPVYSTYAIHDVLENIKILLYIKYGLIEDTYNYESIKSNLSPSNEIS